MPTESPRHNVDGEVFMVHGGFYYQVEKKKIYPGEIPKTLHWFKWEATLTWVTGFSLFVFLYYLRGASLLINPQVLPMTQWQAIGLSLGLIVGSWILYDLIWNANIIKIKAISAVLSLLSFGALVFGTTQMFTGRGAFILVGVVLGSLMLLNVWIRILPGQAKMLREALAGQIPDYSVSLKSKIRSVHNTYFTFPVLFIMLSNHYAAIYNHTYNWVLLILLCVSGALVRHAMVTKNPIERWTLLPASIGLMALVFVSSLSPALMANSERVSAIEYTQIKTIIEARCLRCHSTHNTDENYKIAPKGVVFENLDLVKLHKDKMIVQVSTNVMPLGNLTQMTEDERVTLVAWLKQLN